MADLSQDELQAITDHPVGKGLETLRTIFGSRYLKSKDADVTEVVDRLTSGVSNKEEKDFILDFVLGLLTQPAARTIPSRIGEGSLSGDLASLYARLSQGQEEAKHIAPLLKLVFTPKSGIAPQDSDADIWTAVFDLIARTKQLPLPQPTTPPPSHPPFISSFQQTPWKFSTGAFADASENRKLVDAVLGEELLPTLRIDVPDFITAVFGHIPELDKLAETVFERCQEGETPLYTEGSGWNGWPPNAEEPLVLEWLEDLMTRIMPWTNDVNAAASRQIYNGPSTYLEGSPIKRKMDVGIMLCCGQSKTAHGKTHESKFHWAQILVTGELKSNSSEDGREGVWLDLATYAREVFRTQARRFVLGFTLCGDVMRLWHFDRSGSSGSFPFEINQEGLKFVRVMLGYHLMNDKQLGLDLTIQESDGRRYMEITRDGQCERLILTKKIKKQAVVVGRATTCWKAYCDKDQSKEPLLVKWSWQYEERSEEGELIKEATEKGARNIARYYHHETVQVDGKNDDTVENVRRGLMKTCARTWFRQRSTNEPDASAPEPLGKSVANQSRSQSQSQSHSLLQKRSSTTAQMAPQANLKRSCSSLESRNPVLPVHNRVHRLVITRDFGKPIYEASSPVALITGMIGAIKGHESLLNTGILHRDISIGNIMLRENEDEGFLIDFDLGIRTGTDRASGAPGKTGTKVFMAIGALVGEPHTFMHDLESFFWVLFWICIHCDSLDGKGEVKRRIVSQYERWNYAGTEDLAFIKRGIVVEEASFNKTIAGFTPCCQSLIPCVQELRKYMFPDGKRWEHVDKGLYSRMIDCFTKHLVGMRED